jgi:Protein of unknown function (DUF3800)
MNIYIDEAGSFVPPQMPYQHSYCLTLSLAVPSTIQTELFYEFLRLRDAWPNQAVEIKGSSLDESQATQIINLVSRYPVLVNFFAVDMSTHGDALIEKFKNQQANEITAHLTPEHHDKVVAQMHDDAAQVRQMPNQLFLQAYLTILLVLDAAQDVPLFYAQRIPSDLGSIGWVIDRKNREITQMEKMWATYVLPFGESWFAKNPHIRLKESNYSYFDERYTVQLATADARTKEHLEWLQDIHGKRGSDDAIINAKALLSEQRKFVDSRDCLGVQLADMLGTILRRALNGRLQFDGWKDFGKLLVHRWRGDSWIIQIGSPRNAPRVVQGHASNVIKTIMKSARWMLAG